MMKVETVEKQILPVLRLFWAGLARGEPLREAFRGAVREVADDKSVAHQTVLDGFTRRLQLDTIEQLYGLLKQWTEGDSRPLATQLKASSDNSAHDKISAFFVALAGKMNREPGVNATFDAKFETFSFGLPQSEARMLCTIAEIEGVSREDFVIQAVRSQLAARMKAAAQDLMR